MSKAPKLRFPEFKGEWEEKELGEVGDVTASGDLEADSFSKELTEQHIYPIYSNAIVDEGLYGYSTHFKHLPNSITITARGTLGVAFVRQTKFTGIGRLLVISNIVNSDASFLKENWNFLAKIPFENGGIPQLTAVKAKTIKLLYPSLEEQQKIADCLSALDEQIAAEEEALEALKAYKKGLLQQLFPEGVSKSTPPPLIFNKLSKLRFAGFEGEWEEVKLGEIGCFYRGITYGSENISKEGLLVLRSSNIQDDTLIIDKDLVFIDKEAPTELLLQKGDIVICMSNGSKGLVGKNAEYKGNYYNNITVGAFCSLFRPKIAIAKYVFQTEQYSNYILLSMGGGNINNLKNSTLEKYTCYIPKDLAEQEKIANCLSSLDELIEAKNEKIKLLKSYKKGLLQQMFVN